MVDNKHVLDISISTSDLTREIVVCGRSIAWSLVMKKGKRIKNNVNGEIPLPEAVIQHVQSFLSGKEAARSTILSKSWYHAWLTRPTIDLDESNFKRADPKFETFATKTMQRYIDSSLTIDSFRLFVHYDSRLDGADKLIVNAMKMGAMDIHLALPYNYTLPQEVMGSKTLFNLSLTRCCLDGNHVSCSSLKSLTLSYVRVTSDDEFKHIISCCNSLEELSLSRCYGLKISRSNLYELLKLRRLFLSIVDVDDTFFTDFASRFPCLKDLSILLCRGPKIDSPSLQTINLEANGENAKFDVPNIRKFTYECFGLPSKLSITGAVREWKLDITVHTHCFNKPSWFLNLKKLLKKLRLSRITLTLDVSVPTRRGRYDSEHEIDIAVAPKPLEVENLKIDAPSSYCCALLVRLFGICRPKFLTLYQPSDTLDVLCKRLMQQQSITPNCNSGIPDQSMFGQFGLKIVKLQVYELIDKEWRPLLLEEPLDPTTTPKNKLKLRFELTWE